jgi:Cu/Ag efflux protein CusF
MWECVIGHEPTSFQKKKSRDLKPKISAKYFFPSTFKNITSNREVGGDTVKNMIKVLLIALTSLVFNGVSFAQAKPATPATPAAPTMEKKTEMKSEKAQATVVTGRVTSVDAKTGKLTVKTKDKEVNLTTDSKSTEAALEKLKVGDTAKVFERGGTVIAASPVKAESKTKAVK